jgi:hypothetical protein
MCAKHCKTKTSNKVKNQAALTQKGAGGPVTFSRACYALCVSLSMLKGWNEKHTQAMLVTTSGSSALLVKRDLAVASTMMSNLEWKGCQDMLNACHVAVARFKRT